MKFFRRFFGNEDVSEEELEKNLKTLMPKFVESIEGYLKERRRDRRFNYFKTVISTFRIVLIALAIIVPVGFYWWAANGGLSDDKSGSLLQETYKSFQLSADGDNDRTAKVFIVPVEGIISGTSNTIESNNSNMVIRVKNMFDEIEETDNVEGVILYIDSPGGTVVASDQIYRFVRDWKKRTGIPVVSHFGSVSASGGYYIAQATDKIAAGRHTVTGSIGVIMQVFNFQNLVEDKLGVGVRAFTSGKYKDTGSPFREMREDEEEMFQDRVEEAFSDFVDVVADGRKGVLTRQEVENLADGRTFDGDRAEELGLVDELAPFPEMVRSTAMSVTASKDYTRVRVIRYKWVPPKSRGEMLLDLLGFDTSSPLGDRLDIQREFVSKPMYLWADGVGGEISIP